MHIKTTTTKLTNIIF